MQTLNFPLTSRQVMQDAPVIPVIVLNDVAHAVPMARALLAGGIRMLEITLRTPQALACMEAIARDVPEAVVGAGTVRSAQDAQAAAMAGARFVVSPGYTQQVGRACKELGLPLLPGVATASELMLGLNHGLSHFKLFPASAINGIALAKAFSGPFPEAKFCTTGGISESDLPNYLAEKNIPSVGVSWLASRPAIAAERWDEIAAILLTLKTQNLL